MVGAFRVVTYISTTLMTVYGMLQVQFASTASILLVRFTLLLVLIGRFGLVGAGFAVAVVAILEEAFYLVVTFRRFHLRPAKLFAGNWRSAIATAAMVAVVLPMQTMFDWGPTATIGHLAVQGTRRRRDLCGRYWSLPGFYPAGRGVPRPRSSPSRAMPPDCCSGAGWRRGEVRNVPAALSA